MLQISRRVTQGSAECVIKVDSDEFPDITTQAIATDKFGQPRMYTALGELAGNNLIGYLEEQGQTIHRISVRDDSVNMFTALTNNDLRRARQEHAG